MLSSHLWRLQAFCDCDCAPPISASVLVWPLLSLKSPLVLPYGLGQMSLETLPRVTQHGLQATALLIRLPAGSGTQSVPKPISSAVQLSGQGDAALATPSFFPKW